MSLYWSVDLLILKMYWSGIGGKWRSTDHEYVLLWVSTDQCTFTIRISTDQDWAVKRRCTDQYSLLKEDLLIMITVIDLSTKLRIIHTTLDNPASSALSVAICCTGCNGRNQRNTWNTICVPHINLAFSNSNGWNKPMDRLGTLTWEGT